MTETVIGDLTNLILEAGTTPSLWEELLPTFSRAFPGLKSTIHFEDPGGSPHRTAYVDGIDRQAVETYAAHFGALNPWNPFWATTAPFHAHVSDEVAPAEKYRNTEFYSDWLRPLGEADSAVGMKILTGEAGFGAMSLHFSPRLADQYNRSLGYVVQSVAGHMRNALALNRRLLTNAQILKPLEVVIGAFDEPTFLLDRSGRIRLHDVAPNFYPALSSLCRLVMACWPAVKTGSGAEPFAGLSGRSRREWKVVAKADGVCHPSPECGREPL